MCDHAAIIICGTVLFFNHCTNNYYCTTVGQTDIIGHIPRVQDSVSGSSAGVTARQLIITTRIREHSCNAFWGETFGKKNSRVNTRV